MSGVFWSMLRIARSQVTRGLYENISINWARAYLHTYIMHKKYPGDMHVGWSCICSIPTRKGYDWWGGRRPHNRSVPGQNVSKTRHTCIFWSFSLLAQMSNAKFLGTLKVYHLRGKEIKSATPATIQGIGLLSR